MYGLPVFSCQEVADKYDGVAVLELGKKTKIGGFTVQPISVLHSCECFSYIIYHSEFGKLLFTTDCSEFKYKIKDLNHIIIESNYDEETILENMSNNHYSSSQFKNHMSFDNTLETLKVNNNSQLQNIVLCHLSSSNSNAKLYKDKVIENIGISNVFIAEKGLVVELNKEEF